MDATDRPLASVVMATHDHARYIESALRSVAEQTYEDLELVLVDDASSDASVHIAERYLSSMSERFRRVVLRRNSTFRGISFSLARGVALAEGAYVSLMSAADAYAPTRVERLVRSIREGHASSAFSATMPIDSSGSLDLRQAESHQLRWQGVVLSTMPTISWGLLSPGIAVPFGAVMTSRKLDLTLCGRSPMGDGMGSEILLRAARVAEPRFVAEPLYLHRVDANRSEASAESARLEAGRARMRHFRRVMTSPAPNRLLPSPSNWPTLFYPLLRALGVADEFDAMYQPYISHHRTVEATAIEVLFGEGRGGAATPSRFPSRGQ